MPPGVRGALVHLVSALPIGPLNISWLPADAPRLPLGRIRLHWEPVSLSGWNVTAYLGLTNADVHLASRPAAPDDWPHLVRLTIHEVRGPRGGHRRPRPLPFDSPRSDRNRKGRPVPIRQGRPCQVQAAPCSG
ncbi:hypothetical protein [Streptomyces sp. CA-106131]|uniref:hypothetical protein n=1 Tax=Streptomyces sp. CA-106131 TaxID=3240045 RepID=UPI003D8A8DA8